MAIVQVQELIEAGVHYGHRASRWNPKMRPYIFGKRNLIHIIDLRETVRGLVRASKFLNRVVSQGSLVLFVGTKKQAQEAVVRESHRCHMPFVAERWIGGTFTNFRTIRNRLQRLDELERLVSTGEINSYSKKRKATLLRELEKVQRNLTGIRTMNRLPGAMVVIDPGKEATAVRESRKMGIPVVALIDTDSNPEFVDLPIPGNDDSIRSIDLVLTRLADAINDGMHALPKEQVDKFQGDYVKAHTPVQPYQPPAEVSSAPPVAEVPAAAPPAAAAVPTEPAPVIETPPVAAAPAVAASPDPAVPSAPAEGGEPVPAEPAG